MVSFLSGRLAAMMLALAGAGLSQKLAVEIVPGSAFDRSFPAMRDGRPVNIESRSLQLLTADRDGNALRELVLFREPANGQVISLITNLRDDSGIHASTGDLLPNTVVSVDEGAMRAFFFVGYSLLISESKARYASLDAAQERTLADFAASSQLSHQWDWWSTDEHWIRLLERLPKGLAGHVGELRSPLTHLRDLTRSGGCWSMAVDGANEESTRILVDNNYDLSTAENCAKPRRTVSHVKIQPSSETKLQAPALRNNLPATVEVHSRLAQVTFPDGQNGRLHLFMLYDPSSHLFLWDCWALHPTEPDSVVETERQNFLRYTSVFIAEDRIVTFSSSAFRDSTERYPDFQTAENHVLSVLERMRGNIQAGRSLSLSYRELDTSGIPRDFFHQCGHAEMGNVRVTRVAKVERFWRLSLSGANGNSAILTLKDNYETAGVQLSTELQPASIERVVRSETMAAVQGGGTAHLDFRELQIRYPSDCGSSVARAALIFDLSSHLSWWRNLGSDEAFTPAVVETEGKIVVFSTAMPYIEVTESIERHVDWNEFQSHLLNLFWQGRGSKRYWVVDLTKRLPEEFLQRTPSGSPATTSPQVARTAIGWRIVVAGANAQTAVVEIDSGYQFIRAKIQP